MIVKDSVIGEGKQAVCRKGLRSLIRSNRKKGTAKARTRPGNVGGTKAGAEDV
jgi:hypothetical protein